MVPTNPLDRKTARPTPGAVSLRATRSAGSTAVGDSAEDGPAVQMESGLSALARATAGRLDRERLATLREAVRNGTYEVDAKSLAKRIVDDAVGPEGE
jgi:flagellar biosynthesis anti-sigma factor FlgM